jgi:nicotinamide-nucleotide amidase
VVGDNPERLQQVIAQACKRAQILIFTGGLGPTPDDLTTETLANFFGVALVEDVNLWQDIQHKFAERGRIPTASNRKQALLPMGAQVLANPTGTAPGIIWSPQPALTILTFPGVPREMHRMWQETAVPYLQSLGWGQTQIYSQVLRFYGIPEAALAETVAPLLELSQPTVAPYAGKGEARLRISAKATSATAAAELIAPVAAQIRELTGDYCYGVDDDTLAMVVGQRLKERGETLSVAESCTGGGLGAALTSTPGSSAYFWGGVIAYDNRVKQSLLEVDETVLAEQGAVSHTVAAQMAAGVRAKLQTTWGLSITGIAGPDGGTSEKPVGLVYIGMAGPTGTQSFVNHFSGRQGRDWVRLLSTSAALNYLRKNLLTAD